MALKDIDIKPVYYSDELTLLTKFYIPTLEQSIRYDRIAGYFCSNSLALSAKGLVGLIKNGGKVRLIANVVISEEDQQAIMKALEEKEKEILSEFDQVMDHLEKDHIKVLGWLVKNNLMEIKIAVVNKGIEHQKIGILEDSKGNLLSFSGSENETAGGWLHNDEQFHVFCSWIDGDLAHLKPDIDRFNCLWQDKGRKVRVYPISEAFKRGLVKIAPKDNEEFKSIKKEIIDKLLNMEGLMTKKKEIGLRDYQEKAITEWINNKFRGIFEMATGTGKTFTALGCLCKLREIKERLVTVICCPYGHLVSQWSKEITNFGFEDLIIIADSSNRNWNEEVANNINYVNNDYKKRFIIITTYRTFSSNKFIELINKVDTDLFIIADEMHWSGAESYKKGLIEKYNLRLGLSATPIRYMDDEGSTSISNYFGGSIYQFDLKRAINEINPDTGKSYLTPYNYYPYFIELEGNELEEYDLLSKKMARIYRSIRDKSKKEEMLQRLAEKRQKIITNASNKITAFNEIIDILTELKYALVYCSEKQIDKIQEILGNQDIINHRFTGEEGTTPSKSYGGLSERDFLLKKFAETTYQVLVAMKCLDEGVDVPPARKAVILASSGNPKEYIQRRGRVLRRFPGKEIADIYDIIVVPSLSGVVSDDFIKMEKNILTKEIKRYEEFAKIANNGLEALNKIFPIKRRYNLA